MGLYAERKEDIPPVGVTTRDRRVPVLIVVDDVNQPTGTWLGELVEVTEAPNPTSFNDTRGKFWAPCWVVITDPRCPDRDSAGERSPGRNYTAYLLPEAAMPVYRLLTGRIDAQLGEIRGLKKRIDIERDVFHGVLRALVDRAEASKLIERLTALLDRLSR